MSYFKNGPFNNSSDFYNFNMNDLNQEVYFPFSSNQDVKKKMIHLTRREDERNIWKADYGSNYDWTTSQEKMPSQEVNNINFVPKNYDTSNFSNLNIPDYYTFSKPIEEQKNGTRLYKHWMSNDFEENVYKSYKKFDINSIVDRYYNNKISLESRDSTSISYQCLTPNQFTQQSKQSISNESTYNSTQNQTKLSSSLNSSGNFSSSSNSDDYNQIYHDYAFMSHRRNDSKDENLKPIKKVSSSLFLNEKESKGEEFADLQELMNSIQVDLWEYAKTQRGSRNLQKLLNKLQPENIDILLENIKNNFPEIMKDTYGNYFCQKLIQSCSADQRIFIIKNILDDFTDISCHNSGTHALQTIIEIINLTEEEELIKEAVKNDILKLSFNPNGTHVIQKIITSIKEPNRDHINNTVLINMNKLINDSNGVCVLKKFINGNKNPSYKEFILLQICSNSLEVVQNPFGNYLIQHILDEWGQGSAQEIVDVIINNVISLSMQKFSSNVVEKCFDVIDMFTRRKMCTELFNPCKISSLLKNKYGNFVLQKAIQSMTLEEKMEIRDILAKRVKFSSNKEKARFRSLIEVIQSSAM